MINYSIRRFLTAIPTLFIIASLIFLAMHVLPGDPAVAALGEQASADALENLREKWGLNRPLWVQYTDFITDLIRGEMGRSYAAGQPVNRLLWHALPYTLALTVAMLTVGVIIGIPLGVITAIRHGTVWDSIVRFFSLLGISIPPFYLGVLLLLAFSVTFRIFPVMGAGEAGNLLDQLYHLVLPALAGGIAFSAYVTRLTRSNMLNVLNEDYIRTARAKGLKEMLVVGKHCLRNVLVSIVTFLGIYFIVYTGGAVLIEVVFSRPGLGRLIMVAVRQRDYKVIQAVMVVFSFMVVFMNLIVDLLYGFLDPRISYD